uniref:Unk like zinc finger n=1 Tax=Astyanax mexicanus TaxID=7994 RepID=A0A8B9GTV9_ASTMX
MHSISKIPRGPLQKRKRAASCSNLCNPLHREIQAQEALQNGQLGSGEGIPDLQPGVLASQAMIEKTLIEDPRWQDTNFVLANYKTEQCTKPPRLCRQGYACPHYHNSRDRRRNPRKFKYRSTPCPSVKHGDEWGEPSKCDSGDSCQYCHSRTEQQFHPEIYKSTKCNDMRQTGYCPRGPFCAFAHVERIPSTEETMSTLLTAMQSGSQVKLGSQQYPECPVSEWSATTNSITSSASNNGQAANVCSPVPAHTHTHPPHSGSIYYSWKCLIALFLYGLNSTAVLCYVFPASLSSGSALDLNFSDINVASLDKELEDQDNNGLGLTSQRLLGGSAPVNIPGSLARSSSLHSSSSLSASPLSSLSQSLSQSLLSGMAPQQSQSQAVKSEHGLLGTPTSTQNSLGLNGGTGSIWDFVSGSLSPSPSPVFSSLSSSMVGSSSADLGRLLRELDEAKRKIKQWEDAWHQVKQACEAWQKDAQETKEQVKSAEAERQLAEQKREDTERKLKELQSDFDVLCRSPNMPLLRSYGDLDQLPLSKLHSIQSQLRSDLDLIDGVIYQLQSKKCIVCQKHDRCIVLQPCQHYVLCENCAPSKTECPYCKTKILKW